MPRRPPSPARLASIALAAAALACSLRTSGLDDLDAGSTLAGGGADASSVARDATADASSDDAASTPEDATIDASADDASIATDAIILDPDAPYDASGSPDACDLDRDGHRARGDTCNGDDCCDYDGRAYPGEKGYFDTKNACGAFDYDCDGKDTPEIGVVACKLGFFSCSGDGFASDTACGMSNDFVSCSFGGFSCNENKAARLQPCR